MERFFKPIQDFGHTTKLYKITKTMQKSGKVKKYDAALYVLCGWNCVRDILIKPKIIGSNKLLISDSFMRPLDFNRVRYGDNVYLSIANVLNCVGSKYESLPGDRWGKFIKKENIEVKPWRVNNKKLILISYNTDAIYYNNQLNIKRFSECISACINKGFEVIMCSHPVEVRRKLKYSDASKIEEFSKFNCKFDVGSDKYLNDAVGMISYPGSLNFKSIMLGIPTFPVMKCYLSNLYEGYNLDINSFLTDLPTPNRTKWFNWLAYQQWTYGELDLGLPWKFFIEDGNIQYDKN